MDDYRFAGYRVLEFSQVSKTALNEIADQLIPHERDILERWIQQQCRVWKPPGLSSADLEEAFGAILRTVFSCMEKRELELCLDQLEEQGAQLAEKQFPFEALIISIHFLEESYMPYMLKNAGDKSQRWLVAMDEFLHAALAAIATSYFDSYRRELLDQAEVGRIVQEGLLAEIPKNTADLEVAHVYISARERAQLGGDFLDFFVSGRGRSTFLIGDMSGHGLEAAADSVMLRSLFKGFMCEKPDLAEAMTRANRVLSTELDLGQFATALAINYEPSGRMQLVSAGHPFPIVCDGECRMLPLDGAALAVTEDASYRTVRHELKPGGVFVAYTDGLVESRNGRRGEMFGDEGAMSSVLSMSNAPARAIAEHLIDESLRFAGGRFQDDVAVLVLKRRAG